ncbi:putative protein OS=Sphingobium scionense OX=1404341 GN=GGQ90_005312 PE=4 SV=1 [Sphingobium scionense]
MRGRGITRPAQAQRGRAGTPPRSPSEGACDRDGLALAPGGRNRPRNPCKQRGRSIGDHHDHRLHRGRMIGASENGSAMARRSYAGGEGAAKICRGGAGAAQRASVRLIIVAGERGPRAPFPDRHKDLAALGGVIDRPRRRPGGMGRAGELGDVEAGRGALRGDASPRRGGRARRRSGSNSGGDFPLRSRNPDLRSPKALYGAIGERVRLRACPHDRNTQGSFEGGNRGRSDVNEHERGAGLAAPPQRYQSARSAA